MTITKEGIATFELELDLKDSDSKIYLYKVSLEEPPRGKGSGRAAAGPWGRNLGGPCCVPQPHPGTPKLTSSSLCPRRSISSYHILLFTYHVCYLSVSPMPSELPGAEILAVLMP